MSNELSTKVYKLDFKELIDNATNKVYWAKKWALFEYNGLKIEFTLNYIDITDNKLLGKLELNGKEHKGYLRNPTVLMSIPLEEANFNEIALNKELVGRVCSLYIDLGERDLRISDEYYNLKAVEDDFNGKLEEIAEDFLDSHGIDNRSIREAYIDKYVGDNSKNIAWQWVSDSKSSTYVPDRVTFAYIMNCDDKAEYIIKESGLVDCEHILKEAKELKEMLEYDDMSEYEDRLEDI